MTKEEKKLNWFIDKVINAQPTKYEQKQRKQIQDKLKKLLEKHKNSEGTMKDLAG